MSTMRDADMPLLGRIEAAIRRVTHGDAAMRIPAEATDPDLVLRDCKNRIAELEAALDAFGVAIADAGYAWTPEMRSAYEKGTK